MRLLELLELSWLEPAEGHLEEAVWPGRCWAGQEGAPRVTGGLLTYQCLQTCEKKLKGTRIEALAQQCWKPHMMVPFMPDLGVVCFPAD